MVGKIKNSWGFINQRIADFISIFMKNIMVFINIVVVNITDWGSADNNVVGAGVSGYWRFAKASWMAWRIWTIFIDCSRGTSLVWGLRELRPRFWDWFCGALHGRRPVVCHPPLVGWGLAPSCLPGLGKSFLGLRLVDGEFDRNLLEAALLAGPLELGFLGRNVICWSTEGGKLSWVKEIIHQQIEPVVGHHTGC